MGPLSGFLSRNLTLKASAFGIALLLWVAVRAEAPNRQDLSGVPVRVELADPQWALVGDPIPGTVTIRFGGPSRELIRMALERPVVVVPLEAVSSGDTIVVLNAAWVRLQDRPGVTVEEIQPSTIRLSLEPIERASRPIAARLEGALPDHLALAEPPLIAPAELRLAGARSRLAQIDSVRLLPFDLAGITASGRFPVGVDSAGLGGVQLPTTPIELELLVEDRVERMVSGIPILLPEEWAADPNLLIRPATGAIVLRGARTAVERADPTALRFVVQAPGGGVPAPGAEAEFPLALTGLPPLLEGELRVERALVSNRSEGTP